MKRKRGITKSKRKLTSLTKVKIPNIVEVNTQGDFHNNEVNGTSKTRPPQKGNLDDNNSNEVIELPSEDSTSSFARPNTAFSTNLLKKSRSKISKSIKAISSSSTKVISNAEKVQIRRTRQRGLELPNQDPEHEEEELKVALEVIRKVMEMDAAEPFNVPVDPVALGIPDYFDIIDTPMDFGTICCNIEDGIKYKNTKDVMRDVQYIWDNCCRYNRKGHYVLELMKRVKKNFTKLWTEAGLCKEQKHELDDSCLPPLNPMTTCNIDGQRNLFGSIANFARSLQQDMEDLTEPQPDQPSIACTESYKSHQKPGHYQLGSNVGRVGEAAIRGNPHDCSVDLLDCSFTHPNPRRNFHEISQSQSSLRKNEAHQPQQISCQCHPTPLQPQHSHEQANTFIACSGQPRKTLLAETTVRGRPCAPRCSENRCAENPSSSHQNKIFHQQEYHDHQSSLCCSQPCRPQKELCHGVQCSGQKQHFQPFAGVDDDNVGEFESYCSEQGNVSCTKHGTRNSKCPMTDFTNHQLQDQIPSSCLHKQKPSETYVVESMSKVAKRTPAKYPAVPMIQIINRERQDEVAKHSPAKYPAVPMIEIINRKRQDKVTPEQQLHPDEPQQESYPGQNCSQPWTSSLQDFPDIFPTVSKKTKKKHRGPARCLEVFDTEDKIPITINEAGEPIGPEVRKLASFLGFLARNGHVAPLTYVSWKALPKENKEKMWQLVQSKFDINPESKSWALKSVAKKWSCWKSLLKSNHYNPHETHEARLADCPERVLPEQWRILVEFWNSPEAQEVSKMNKACASQVKLYHASGSKSHAQVREEQRLKRPDGKEPSQAELFILTRTRRNGQPVSEASSTIISQLREAQGTSQQDTTENEVFIQVMGEDKGKRKRGHSNKLDPITSKNLPTESEKTVSGAQDEVLEMKEKIVAVEQTCAQMAVQMAAMMSMMQKNFQQ